MYRVRGRLDGVLRGATGPMGTFPAQDPSPIERVSTADGGSVAIKRRPMPGGVPVLFIHGLAVNADLWDLPDISGPGFRYRSLARCCHDAGFDVWLMNLRGHGKPHMLSEPPPGQTDWCVDHFILQDLPAVLNHIRAATGQPPFVVAASMGSMSLAGYLQGATDAGTPTAPRIVANPDLARRRQQGVAGCVFAEFPARLIWPISPFDEDGKLSFATLWEHWRNREGAANFPFELVARSNVIQALIEGLGGIPISLVKGNPHVEPWYRHLPGHLPTAAAAAELYATRIMLAVAATFTGATNHRAEVLLNGRRYVIDDMKAGVLRQMAKSVRQRAFVSYLGQPDHVYSDHYHLIEVPALVVQGGRDRIANHDIARDCFFDVIRSRDKTWLADPEIAHGEIEAAPAACERLYPRIVDWLAARRPAVCASARQEAS